MLNIVIGYDICEPIAFHVLAHSIMTRASEPVAIYPLILSTLERKKLYWRERNPQQSTDFTYSRFLAPFLTGAKFGDRTIFMDCDMLCLTDIYEVLNHCSPLSDVCVVKHDYTPKPDPKFLGQVQTVYQCKNWSSFMVFNPHRMAVRQLDPDFVNDADAMDLHQFKWCRPGSVGSLPVEWNHLVGEYAPNPDARIVHFTRGGPWFPEFADCEYADVWREECSRAMYPQKV